MEMSSTKAFGNGVKEALKYGVGLKQWPQLRGSQPTTRRPATTKEAGDAWEFRVYNETGQTSACSRRYARRLSMTIALRFGAGSSFCQTQNTYYDSSRIVLVAKLGHQIIAKAGHRRECAIYHGVTWAVIWWTIR